MNFIQHVRIAARRFRKSPIHAGLNILGLAFGTAGFALIALWVRNETGFDRHLPAADRVYRVATDVSLQSGQRINYAFSTSGLAVALKTEYPEVQASTRLFPAGQVLLRHGDAVFFETGFFFADAGLLSVFALPLESGDPAEALKQPNSLLLTREAARRYFGDEDPVGKTLVVDNETAFRVTGVLAERRGGTHLPARFIAYPGDVPYFQHPTWNSLGLYTYIKLAEGVDPADFETRIQELATKYVGPRGRDLFAFRLQPLTSIHLHSDRQGEFAPVVGVAQIRLLSAVAVLLLLVACVNFVNLSTARAGRRSREVGLRKVVGARRPELFRQFLSEAFLSTLAAFGLGLGAARLALPWFNSLWGSSLRFSAGDLPGFGALALAVGLLAGSYPALVLSSFRPSLALRWERQGTGAALLRKGLIVFQYAAAIALFIAAGVVTDQMRYLRERNIGFDRDRVLAVRLRGPDVIRNIEGIKGEFLRRPDIAAAAAASLLPGLSAAPWPYIPEGFDGNAIMVRTIFVDHDFIPAMGMSVTAGRNFSRDFATDTETAYVINRTAQVRFGWDDAVGKILRSTNTNETPDTAEGRVIGVIEDFPVGSLRREVEPVVLRVRPAAMQFLILRFQGADTVGTRTAIEERMAALQPEFPPETFFLDARLEALYGNEVRLGRILRTFSTATVLIACLGLLGIAAYEAEQRTREIGIRKVLGAATPKILWLLTRQSAGLVLLANAIAWPAGYLLMQGWLRGFAYRTSIAPALLVVSGAAALALAVITVAAQAFRAASADPVKSIRYE